MSRPENVDEWTIEDVVQWGREIGLNDEESDLLSNEAYSGISLRRATRDSLKGDGFKGGRADLILDKRDALFPPPPPQHNG